MNNRVSDKRDPTTEKDERMRYLLKYGKVVKEEGRGDAVFAELPQIPGVLIYYRKNEVKIKNPGNVNFEGMALTHIPLMEGEEKVNHVNISNNQIQKIENLVSLQNLTSLNLSHNQIKKAGGFENVPNIKVLDLSFNQIETAEGMDALTILEDLNISHNKICDLNAFSKNQSLLVLDLSYNEMVSLGGFKSQMSRMVKLSLKKNQMIDLKGIESFPNLTYLKLSRNNISSLVEIRRLGGLRGLKGVSLYKNPISEDKPLYTKIVLSICRRLESLDHCDVKEWRRKYNITPSTQKVPTETSPSPASPRIGKLSAKKDKVLKNNYFEINKEVIKTVSEKFKTRQKLEFGGNEVKQKTEDDNSDEESHQTLKARQEEEAEEQEEAEELEEQEEEEEEEEEEEAQESKLDPKSIEAVKIAFEEKIAEKSYVSDTKRDSELWLGSPANPIGFFKRTGTTGYKIVGDGIFTFFMSKSITLKSIDELTFSYVFIENLKSKKALVNLSQIKRLKSLKLQHNNIRDYLEIVKFECFAHLVNVQITHNPINKCTYLREFIVYRFNHLRYFNKVAIDYQDLQKAKVVFNSFDKILQIPAKLSKKTGDIKGKEALQLCRTLADSVILGSLEIKTINNNFDKIWSDLLSEVLAEI